MKKQLEIWSDGGKRKEIASWAFCLYSPDIEKVIYEKRGCITGTSQQGELSAGLYALEFVSNRFTIKQLASMDITLYSDSQYMVKGLNEWLWGWKNKGWKGSSMKIIKNVDYWKKLDTLKLQMPSVKFKWIKGHAGIEMNEYVDKLCTKALEDYHAV
jgi:ribonuclease HI